ncbi:MAG: glycosyltransferase family 2 protein [Candidatus Kerfeldbacteria bacterium]|nr:glycosyltransferase family 2 protein [Candidatus Kerfeldbacteria bacterium]
MIKITGIVLTHNNADVVENCLRSMAWLDELIVIDSNSTDQTIELARRHGAQVFTRSLDNFAAQRNFALTKIRNYWVIFVDSDERISFELRQAIIHLDPGNHRAFQFQWRSIFLGKAYRYGGWQNEYHTRLLNKQYCTYVNPIHEELTINGSTGTLPGVIFHFSHRSIETNMYKTVQYAKLQSDEMLRTNFKRISRWNLTWAVLHHFYYRYIRMQGYKDGMEGFIEAVYQAFSQIFVIRAMLWEKQRGKSVDDIYRTLDQRLIENDFHDHALR